MLLFVFFVFFCFVFFWGGGFVCVCFFLSFFFVAYALLCSNYKTAINICVIFMHSKKNNHQNVPRERHYKNIFIN